MQTIFYEDAQVAAFCARPRTEQVEVLQNLANKLRNRTKDDVGAVMLFSALEQLRKAADLTHADLAISDDEVAIFEKARRQGQDNHNATIAELERLMQTQGTHA